MLEDFIKALREAIFATGRSYIDIAGECKFSTMILYRLFGSGKVHKPLRRNATVLVEYLDNELDSIIRRHKSEIMRLRELKVAMKNEYKNLYGERKESQNE